MAPGGSVLWTAQRIFEEPTDKAVGILKLWIHPKREAEATEEMITLLNDLSDYDVVRALGQLKEPKRHIWGQTTTKTNQLNINVIAETTTNGRWFIIKSLLDCGSTGSAVDRKWVERNDIPTRKAIIPSKYIMQTAAST